MGFAVCSEQVFEIWPKKWSKKHHFFGVKKEGSTFVGLHKQRLEKSEHGVSKPSKTQKK